MNLFNQEKFAALKATAFLRNEIRKNLAGRRSVKRILEKLTGLPNNSADDPVGIIFEWLSVLQATIRKTVYQEELAEDVRKTLSTVFDNFRACLESSEVIVEIPGPLYEKTLYDIILLVETVRSQGVHFHPALLECVRRDIVAIEVCFEAAVMQSKADSLKTKPSEEH